MRRGGALPRLVVVAGGLLLIAGWLACAPCSEDAAPAPDEGAAASGATEVSLEGTTWRWVGLAGRESLEVPHPDRYTLRFDARGRFTLRADCNHGAGSYTREGARLRLEAGAMTLAACDPGSLSDRFLALLGRVEGLDHAGDRLDLALSANEGTLLLRAAPSPGLAGSHWEVRAYNNGREAVVGVLEGTVLTVSFGAEGGLSGSAGCNRYRATVAYVDASISIGNPSTVTQERCTEPEGVMEQEAAFLAALASAAVYRLDGERLELRTGEGALALYMVPAVGPAR